MDLNHHNDPGQDAQVSRISRQLLKHSIIIAVVYLLGAVIGAVASLYTGPSSEIPRWNGMGYLLFCVGEFSSILTPFMVVYALVVCSILAITSRGSGHRR